METTRDFLAWLAGFLDGEGSIVLTLRMRPTSSGRQAMTSVLVITITQHVRHRAVLDEIQRTLGFGRVYVRDATGKHGSPKSHWQPTNRSDQRRFLELVLPFLRVKRRQAEAAMRALDLFAANGRTGRRLRDGERVLPESVARELVEIALAMNPKADGTRYQGRSREEFEGMITTCYSPEGLN